MSIGIKEYLKMERRPIKERYLGEDWENKGPSQKHLYLGSYKREKGYGPVPSISELGEERTVD